MVLECRVNQFLENHKEFIKTENGYACKKSLQYVKLPMKETHSLCRILGILHGDGNMSSSRIHITDKDKEYHIKVLHPLFKSVFGICLNLFKDKNRKQQSQCCYCQ